MTEAVPTAVEQCHELLLWLIPLLDKFPRSRRFTLGERLEGGLLEVLDGRVEAAYSRDKQAPLRRANSRLQAVRHLWRLSFELQAIPLKRYERGARLLEDLGRQIGGWSRAQDPSPRAPQHPQGSR